MKTDEIKSMQRKIGAVADGFWGPRSIAACQTYLRRMMPTPHPWPKPDRASIEAFYGPPGEGNLVTLEFPFRTLYEGKQVTRTRCHKLVRASLVRVLTEIGRLYASNRGIMEEAEISASQDREHWRERGLPLTLPHIPKSDFMREIEAGEHDGENSATKRKDHDRPAAATAK